MISLKDYNNKRKKKTDMYDKIAYITFFSLIATFFLWILYKIWWFFIGSWEIEGPLSKSYTTEETATHSIVFLFVVVYIIVAIVSICRGK